MADPWTDFTLACPPCLIHRCASQRQREAKVQTPSPPFRGGAETVMAGARRCECRVRTQHRGIAAVSQRRLPRVSSGTREIMAVAGLGGTGALPPTV